MRPLAPRCASWRDGRFTAIGWAATLVWLTFGDDVPWVDHRGEHTVRPEMSLHLQCRWRLLNGVSTMVQEGETGLDPAGVVPASPDPVYVEYGEVPARPAKGEPSYFHLDLGFAFTTANDGVDVGDLQESEVTGAAWYSLATAERLVGRRIARAVGSPAQSLITNRVDHRIG